MARPPVILAPARPVPGRIRPSRFVAGIALHLAIPAYLLWLAVALFPYLTGSDRDQLAAALGRASLQFLILYTVVVVALALATRAMEPALRVVRERREARDPRAAAGASKARVAAVLGSGGSLGHSQAVHAALERLQSAPWRHEDQRFQTLSIDLAQAMSAFVRAFDAAPPGEREELQALAAGTLNRIAGAAEQLGEERRRLDHGDARTLARYIELRYPSSDFASGENG
jgi:hypothetical protein